MQHTRYKTAQNNSHNSDGDNAAAAAAAAAAPQDNDHSSLVRLLQRLSRERDELALLLVQQSTEAATMKAQADLIPQYRQEIQKTRQELHQWKEMCRQERQKGAILQYKLQRALKALTGSDDCPNNSHRSSSATAAAEYSTTGDMHNTGTATADNTAADNTMRSSRHKHKPRQSDTDHQIHKQSSLHTDRISGNDRSYSDSVPAANCSVASLQAALSPIRMLAHQLAQSGDDTPPPSHDSRHATPCSRLSSLPSWCLIANMMPSHDAHDTLFTSRLPNHRRSPPST